MVYEITEYSLIGKIINVYKERPELKVVPGENREPDHFVDESGARITQTFRTELTTHLSDYAGQKKSDVVNLVNVNDFPIYLPFFADVTEDIPHSGIKLGIEPKTYKGCQLLTQKHGGYLEFFHHDTKETLRIAINSNSYSPVL